ncbi:hypothetical protein Tco_1088615 [Tanacetum coccineum]
MVKTNLPNLTRPFESLDTESLVTSYKKKRIPLDFSALIIGGILGFLQAAFLIMGAKTVWGLWESNLTPQCYILLSGAAIAHVISQYLISIIPLWRLIERVNLVPPNSKHLQFGRFLKNVMAVTLWVTLAASMAARQGSTTMVAFQNCLQVRLITSLLADGLAVAGQAILASAFEKIDYEKVTVTASRVLQI